MRTPASQMMGDLVSVVTTVKNGEKTLTDCVNSVAAQKWPLEMVIVDDGSSDGTVPLLNSLKREYPFLRIVETGGIGRARALNVGVGAARGQWIAILDCDDVFQPSKIEAQMGALPSLLEPAVLCTEISSVEGYGPIQLDPVVGRGPVRELTDFEMCRTNPVAHSSAIIKKSAIQEVGLYDEALPSQVDYDLWVRLKASGYRIYIMKSPLIVRRFHDGQSFERHGRLRYAFRSYQARVRAIGLLKQSKLMHVLVLMKFLGGLLPAEVRKRLRGIS